MKDLSVTVDARLLICSSTLLYSQVSPTEEAAIQKGAIFAVVVCSLPEFLLELKGAAEMRLPVYVNV